MADFKSLLEKFRALSNKEVKELMLRVLDDHLANATDNPCPSILTDEEEAIFESLGFPANKEEVEQ